MKIRNLLISCLALAAAACNTLTLPDRDDTAGDGGPVLRMVKVSRDTISILQEGTYALHASFYPEDAAGDGVSWKSLDEAVATVDEEGLVTGVGFGTTHVVATSLNGALTDSCVVKVIPNVHVESVELSRYEASLKIGDNFRLVATVVPSDARIKDIEWASLNPEVARVTSRGTVIAQAIGEADITATSVDGGKVATCHVTVSRVEVVSVTMTPSEASLHPGETIQLKATLLPYNATIGDVSWSSSAPSVASVSETGLVTAEAVGEAIITVTTLDGNFTDVCTVTVIALPANQKILSFDFSSPFESLTAAIEAVNATRNDETPLPATFTMADNNNTDTYEWELYTGNGKVFSHGGSYLTLNAADYLGTPIIEGYRLKTFTFTQSAKTQSTRRAAMCTSTHKGGVQTSYYDASEEANGASLATTQVGTDYTFTMINPTPGTRYWLVCGAAGIGVSKVVLVFEKD